MKRDPPGSRRCAIVRLFSCLVSTTSFAPPLAIHGVASFLNRGAMTFASLGRKSQEFGPFVFRRDHAIGESDP